MNEILFLLLAFFTVFLSIKLSYYADNLSKNSDINNALIGGVMLAGVTSLPEFVTCFSAIFVDNPCLAIGDILGSNLFNVFMICFFDIVFIKKKLFAKTKTDHNRVLLFLILNYILLYLFICKIFLFDFMSIGIPSFMIVVTYIIYIKSISKNDDGDINSKGVKCKNVIVKLIITSILMVMCSISLTIVVNKLSQLYPSFSSSFLGAIFLGVTTSLPEVITFYTLVSIENYDLALSNILGSNLFNLFVLSLGDLFVLGIPIYNFSDKDTIYLIGLGLLFLVLCLISNCRKNIKNSISYISFSLIVVLLYFLFWFTKFF